MIPRFPLFPVLQMGGRVAIGPRPSSTNWRTAPVENGFFFPSRRAYGLRTRRKLRADCPRRLPSIRVERIRGEDSARGIESFSFNASRYFRLSKRRHAKRGTIIGERAVAVSRAIVMSIRGTSVDFAVQLTVVSPDDAESLGRLAKLGRMMRADGKTTCELRNISRAITAQNSRPPNSVSLRARSGDVNRGVFPVSDVHLTSSRERR